MRILLYTRRHIKINHKTHIRYIDTSPREICRNEDIRLIAPQLHERLFSLVLTLAAVQCDGAPADMLQVFCDGVAVAFDVDEDDNGGSEFAGVEDFSETFLAAVFAADEFDALFDGVDGFAGVSDGDDGGATEVLSCDAFDCGGHGGGVHHCLAESVFAPEVLGH